jgi:hypothetical protein
LNSLRCTLLTDGSSDRALATVLYWLLADQQLTTPAIIEWADLRNLRDPPKRLSSRVEKALHAYPCDLLFVHRDAESETPIKRRAEIREALQAVTVPAICVAPVRMQEAWFLFDEAAIRRASGNPAGSVELQLPKLSGCENIPDPREAPSHSNPTKNRRPGPSMSSDASRP